MFVKLNDATNKRLKTFANYQQKLILSMKIRNKYLIKSKTLLTANIPINKLYNTFFRSFLEKYTHKDIPSISVLKSTYINKFYNEKMDAIRKEV